ncbi:MAG: hypothetical protein ACK55I_24950, partial [bacterium]
RLLVLARLEQFPVISKLRSVLGFVFPLVGQLFLAQTSGSISVPVQLALKPAALERFRMSEGVGIVAQ